MKYTTRVAVRSKRVCQANARYALQHCVVLALLSIDLPSSARQDTLEVTLDTLGFVRIYAGLQDEIRNSVWLLCYVALQQRVCGRASSAVSY